jgi:hypothetical protein
MARSSHTAPSAHTPLSPAAPSAVFPFQQWRVEPIEAADAAASGGGGVPPSDAAAEEAAAEATAVWLEQMAADHGPDGLSRLLPYEVLGHGSHPMGPHHHTPWDPTLTPRGTTPSHPVGPHPHTPWDPTHSDGLSRLLPDDVLGHGSHSALPPTPCSAQCPLSA